MSTPQARLEADVRAALKAGDKERLATLRMLLAELQNDHLGSGKEVDEVRFAALVRKSIKQLHEAAVQFRAGGRAESADKEEREAALLEGYLPQQAGEEEIRAAVRAFLAEQGLAGPAAMGPVMKETMARFAGRADGATVSRIAREELRSTS
jgi:uncharacterized protein YqeY